MANNGEMANINSKYFLIAKNATIADIYMAIKIAFITDYPSGIAGSVLQCGIQPAVRSNDRHSRNSISPGGEPERRSGRPGSGRDILPGRSERG
jgi:hypothetical protein